MTAGPKNSGEQLPPPPRDAKPQTARIIGFAAR
jgi:hypothetical protein